MGRPLRCSRLYLRQGAELLSCLLQTPASRVRQGVAIAEGEGRNGVWLAEQGLDVLSIDFSLSAQGKAQALARERNVKLAFERVHNHAGDYPDAAFDVIVEIFTQFSSPAERKWAGMRRASSPAVS